MAVLSLKLLFSLCCLLIILFTSQANAANNTENFHYFCDFNNRGSVSSFYRTNLNILLSTLPYNAKIDYGFYNVSYGQNTNKVNAIGLCRGDVKPDKCRSCLSGAKANLTQLCPNQKEAIGWYEDELCMLRFSDRAIFGSMENGPAYYVNNMNDATDLDEFNKVVKNLLDDLRTKAASGDSRLKYAAGNAPGPNDQTIYGLVQCTPDLSKSQCNDCLVQSIARIPIDCCKNKIGGRVIRPSCNMRFETSYLFYEPSAAPRAINPVHHNHQ